MHPYRSLRDSPHNADVDIAAFAVKILLEGSCKMYLGSAVKRGKWIRRLEVLFLAGLLYTLSIASLANGISIICPLSSHAHSSSDEGRLTTRCCGS